MSRCALYFRFDSEAAAIAALPMCRIETEDGPAWDLSEVDPGVPVVLTPAVLDEAGDEIEPAVYRAGYHLNLLLPVRDEAFEEIEGWLGTLDADARMLIAGDHPVTPQRVFA
jgi:hypothetical protein